MVTYVYRPDDSAADEFGMVEKTAEMAVTDAPYVVSDEMGALINHADGKHYTSKARFRQATRDAGCVEIGNENPIKPRKRLQLDRRERREDIRRAIHDLRDGRAPSIRQIIEMNKGE